MDKLYPYYELIRDQIKDSQESDNSVNNNIPYSLQINILNKCYQKCIGCRKPDWPDVQLKDDNVYEVLCWLAYERMGHSVIFSGGDPPAHPKFLRFLEFANLLELGTGTLTACLWGKEFNPELFLRYSTWVAISIDGADKKTYEQTRGVNTLDTVCKNIELLQNIKSKHKFDVRLRCNSTISNINMHQLSSILELCHNLGIQCYFYPIHTWDDLKVQNVDKKYVERYVENAINTKDKLHINDEDTNIHLFIEQMDRKPPPICIMPWTHGFLDANGDIMHCCRLINDNGDFIRDPSAVLGNVYRNSISSIMGSERSRKIGNKTFTAKYNCCNECDRYNKANHNFSEWHENQTPISIDDFNTTERVFL